MNSLDLLKSLGEVREEYILSAIESQNHRRFPRRKLLLIAAVLSILLAGCVAYILRLQDFSLGQETVTEEFDNKGQAIAPTENIIDHLSLYGSPDQREAQKEWLDTLDSSQSLEPDIPEPYASLYGCRTWEDVERLDALSEKYHLTLLAPRIRFNGNQCQLLLEKTGINSLLRQDQDAELRIRSGSCCPPTDLQFSFMLRQDTLSLQGHLLYHSKDSFPANIGPGADLDQFTQWEYTTTAGSELLLAKNNKGMCYLISVQETGILVITLDGNLSGGQYPTEILTDQQVEQLAECFDFTISPSPVDAEAFENLDIAEPQETTPLVFHTFEDYLKANLSLNNDRESFTYYDLDGDGTDEFLIGQNGYCTRWLDLEKEAVTASDLGGEIYFGEAGIEVIQPAIHQDAVRHNFYVPTENGMPEFQFSLLEKAGQWFQLEGGWGQEEFPITEEEASELIAPLVHLDFTWTPLLDYPVDSSTLGEYAASLDLTEPQLLTRYQEQADKSQASAWLIRDLNSDGFSDLLLSFDQKSFAEAYTCRYGKMTPLPIGHYAMGQIYLCNDGVLERTFLMELSPGVEAEFHEYVTIEGTQIRDVDFLYFNKAEARWYGENGPIDDVDALARLNLYPRISLSSMTELKSRR